jgi:hypothetical protein
LKRDLITAAIVIAIMVFGIWIGHSVASYRYDEREQTAIKNAIAHCQEPRDCDSQKAINTIQHMADNGQKMKWWKVCWGKEEE